jgi:hypothetical protein
MLRHVSIPKQAVSPAISEALLAMPQTMTLRLVQQPLPMHHVSVVRRFEDMHAGFTARVLLLRRPDGSVEPFLPFIAYQRAFRLRSRSWQDNAARALGLFWDFSIAHTRRRSRTSFCATTCGT